MPYAPTSRRRPAHASPATSPERVYLDHAATTPLAPEALEAMMPYFAASFGNASTLYREGRQAREALEQAREVLAEALGASPPEVCFTSGGTESNNALIAGICIASRRRLGAQKAGHVVASAFEHPAVLEPVAALKRAGFEVTLVRPGHDGFVSPDALKDALKDNTALVSVMAANNEVGTIQPVRELAAAAHERGALFHTDAVQALGKVGFSVAELGVDAASFSAHKVGGPKGVGAFYLRRTTPFEPQQLGGGQEGMRRAGTQNVAGAVGFATAASRACEPGRLLAEAARLVALRDGLAARLAALGARVRMSVPLPPGDVQRHLPGLVSFTVNGLDSQTMLVSLDEAGFALSAASACSASSLKASHVLLSLGMPRDRALGALRVSMGEQTNARQIDAFVHTLSGMLKT
ncbi:MAG: cysteine desulfurase [Coriobacteriales bacterium]|nr:cysteine desulfurase [Coriobacteriales bacterium]